MWFAYRGVSVLVLAPVMALAAVLFSPGEPLMASYTQVFMPAAAEFIARYFPLFLLGAVFGRLMEHTGSARVIAAAAARRLGPGRASLAVVLACAVLTYGGVSLFVVAFAIYPIADALFRQADLPRRLIPAAVALGAFTFTMTALPGTPAIQNAIPMPYFSTTPFAAPGLGVIAAAIMLALGQAWISWRLKRARALGQGYDHGAPQVTPALGAPGDTGPRDGDPPLWLACAPILLVLAANYVFSSQVFGAMDAPWLAEPRFGATHIGAVRGLWAIIAALTLAIAVLLAVHARRLTRPAATLGAGANTALLPIFNTASLVGFGAVAAGLPAFELVRAAIDGLGGGPVLGLAVSASVLAGITGSASGGMSIALDALGASYLAEALAAGISPELLHRVVALATGGLDALPHNGAVVTLLAVCGLTHRQAYGDIFVVAVAAPVAALAAVVVLGGVFGAF
ncbi:MAG: GntP family permease [Oceanicaulis sp.]|nr:GntP family permease [Oceanicaulis sp.]